MKIIIFSKNNNFMQDIITHLKLKHKVIVSEAVDGFSVNKEFITHKPDIAFFEWADDLLIRASQNGREFSKKTKIICRLHSYELFCSYIHLVQWDNYVDDIIFVAPHTKKIFDTNIKLNKTKTHVILNGVDFNKFKTPIDKIYTKKIAYAGYLNHKKNNPLMLYCLKDIINYDPDYTLHIAGAFQDNRLMLYFTDIAQKLGVDNNIKFEGWVENINEWYKDKSFIISTSLFESFGYSNIEAIASGLYPMIHNWYGASDLYHPSSLFITPAECLELLKVHEKRTIKKGITIYQNNIKKYALDIQLEQIDKLIEG